MKKETIIPVLTMILGAIQPFIWWVIYCALMQTGFNCAGLDLACGSSAFVIMIVLILVSGVALMEKK